MSAPKRWIEDGSTPLERDLLRSAPSIEPPPGAQGQVWAAVLSRLPPLGGPPGSPGDGGAGAAGEVSAAGKTAVAAKGAATVGVATAGVALLKGVLLGAGGAVALLTAYSFVAPAPKPEPVPNRVAVVAAPPVASSRTWPLGGKGVPASGPVATATAAALASPNAERRLPAEPRSPAGGGAVEALPAAPAPVEVIERETMLWEEGRLVGEARDSLRRGDATAALVQLEQIRTRFPGGSLAQEREALAIEALARSGQHAAASARATAFLHAYPTSTLAERVQGFVR
jgi:hypothetical protein